MLAVPAAAGRPALSAEGRAAVSRRPVRRRVLSTGSGEFRADWLVGCDGGRSTVRKFAGSTGTVSSAAGKRVARRGRIPSSTARKSCRPACAGSVEQT
ncbi:FAD-dependent monooxygenase [Amycolatopsis sp.]|uniref:FAD-dependent monooxygenase n=1 Tax=Amycolatopsis sp. TaxID=37632 RepID=UPI002C322A28|nr:FAD-dependent monooxygenase [Amycolatopsis sp.]HVV08520.1 FAD-dependent monooxygenase [Amycolatopsis sp.]